MPGMEEIGPVVDLVKLAYKQGWFDQLISALRKKHRVLVLGSTGVGKTNLLDSLQKAMPTAIDTLARTKHPQERRTRILKQPFIFVDTPGAIAQQSLRMKAIRQEMGHGISGVINVVSYGYHEYAVGTKGVFDKNEAVSRSFLERHRHLEIDLLREWTPLLGGGETAKWMMTIVTKADLWWDGHDEVMAHYEKGAYREALGDASQLHPVVLPYCSVFHKFFNRGPLSGRLDDADRDQLRSHLFGELFATVTGKTNG